MIGRDSLTKSLQVAATADAWGPHTGEAVGAMTAEAVERDDAKQRFVELYRELFPPLFGFVRYRVGDVQLAEDITAQVFERALAKMAAVREPSRIRAWLFTIARNAIVDERRRRRHGADLEATDTMEYLWVDSPEGEAERREEWRRLVGHLSRLSDRERELLGLKYAAGLGHREIGQILEISEANVAQIAHRAVAKLRQRFDEETKG